MSYEWQEYMQAENARHIADLEAQLAAERAKGAELERQLAEQHKQLVRLAEYGGPEEAYSELRRMHEELFPEEEGEDSLSTLVIGLVNRVERQLAAAKEDTARLEAVRRAAAMVVSRQVDPATGGRLILEAELLELERALLAILAARKEAK